MDLGGQAAATAAVIGDHLYVGTMGNEVQAVDWKKGRSPGPSARRSEAQPFFASAAATDAIVVVGSRDKRVRGLDRKTGTEVWTFLTEGNVDSSPVVVGGRVFAGSLDGKLYVSTSPRGRDYAF